MHTWHMLVAILERAATHVAATGTAPPDAVRTVLQAVACGTSSALSRADLEVADAALTAVEAAHADARQRWFEPPYDHTTHAVYHAARAVAAELGIAIVAERFEWSYNPESARWAEPPEPIVRLMCTQGGGLNDATFALCDRVVASDELSADDLTVVFLTACSYDAH